MGEWREYNLLELAKIYNEKRKPLSKMQRLKLQGNYPYYGASGIVDYINDYKFDGNFILISEDGENLKTRKTPIAFKAFGKFWVNNHAHIIKGKTDYLDDLLIYFFSNLDLNQYLTGAVQPKLNKATLLSIPINLPSAEKEQKAIAGVLSSLDNKIDLLHRQNKTLEALAQTLFRQWFIEEANDEWEMLELGNFISTVDNRGKTPPNQKEETPYPLIEVNALGKSDRLVDYSVIKKYVNKEIFDTWFRNTPSKYDTLVSTVGSIGAFSMFILERGNIAQNVIALHPKNISPFYLYQVLKYKKMKLCN